MKFYEVLLIGLMPAVMVIIVGYFILKSFLERDLYERQTASQLQKLKQTLPLKLQACERFVLFLERLNPNSLLMRVNMPGASAKAIQATVLKMVREEFEHNFSQQIYLQTQTWQLVKNSKDEVLALVNNAANRLPQNATGNDLLIEIFKAESAKNYPSLALALKAIKAEVDRAMA